MDTAFSIFWWLWCPLAAFLVWAGAVRIMRPKTDGGAIAIGYSTWLFSFLAALLFVSFSGMQLYGFHSDDPWSWAGWFVLFLSPIGLPLLFGAPMVMVLKVLLVWWKRVAANRHL